MKREYLEKLIKEELIEIILKLQQEIDMLKLTAGRGFHIEFSPILISSP